MEFPIVVREVWNSNLAQELCLISTLIPQFRNVSIDTEFPGTVFTPLPHVRKEEYSRLSPELNYLMLKNNVNVLSLIQLGLTFMDEHGNLPTFNTTNRYVWQFNFRDFDPRIHLHNEKSLSFLESQGIDFSKNRMEGIESALFARKFWDCVMMKMPFTKMSWITFHGLYDFGFMIKLLTGRPLPDKLNDFMNFVNHYFGANLFDLKVIAQKQGLHGGLERVARSLGLNRIEGENSHQSGPDSFLTMQVFLQLWIRYGGDAFVGYNHKFYGFIHRPV